jgi:uncharacterized tellurite resistance protein B-like protein
MTDHWFDGVDDVVSDDFRFKAMLGIGEDAYTSVRVSKALFNAWDIAGVAATGSQIAGSATVAKTFFATPSLLASIGIGTATAVTPIGWVIAAGVVSGGAWYGITKFLKDTSRRTRVIPDFINTPVDILGLGLFDLMAPLAFKVAEVDGRIDQSEIEVAQKYFVGRWGYSDVFVDRGFEYIKKNLGSYSIKEAASGLGAFVRENPDCRVDAILKDVHRFLHEMMEADGRVDEWEQMAIERIEKAFADELRFSIGRTVSPIGKAASSAAAAVYSGATGLLGGRGKR